MDAHEFAARFPELDLRRTKPVLFRLNGVGFGLYGRRDADSETGTYVKSHCFCVLWIPLLPLASYRVADAEKSGWYILGRLPPSPAERLVRSLAVAGVVAGIAAIGWNAFTDTDWYRDRAAWGAAETAVEEGRTLIAAKRLGVLVRENPRLRDRARAALDQLLTTVTAQTDSDESRSAIETALRVGEGDAPSTAAWDAAVRVAEGGARMSAEDRLTLLDHAAPAAPSPEIAAAAQERLLASLAHGPPPSMWAVCELAGRLEEKGDVAGCKALLEPLRARLGSTEGARILAAVDAAEGRADEALALLAPYVATHTKAFVTAAKELRKQSDAAQSEALEALDRGAAGDAWYTRYDAASESEQGEMVRAWVLHQMASNPGLQAARRAYGKLGVFVPAAMDLGILRMSRARAMTDRDAAQLEMERAEKAFSTVHVAMADDPDFLLTRAQVAVWLDRPAAAERFLDLYEAAAPDPFVAKMAIGQLMGAVGRHEASLEAWKTAYQVAGDDAQRQAAAAAIASNLCRRAPRDALPWFDRADTTNPGMAGSFAVARAHTALADGDLDAARDALREALGHFDRAGDDPAVLNNSALAAADLAAVAGDAGALAEAADRLRKAAEALPTDLTVLQNAASVLGRLAEVRALGDGIDLRVGTETTTALRYDTAAGRDEIRARIAARPEHRDAVELLDRCRGLAPRNPDVLVARTVLARDSRDAAALRTLRDAALRDPPEFEVDRDRFLLELERPRDASPTVALLRTLAARRAALPAGAPAEQRRALAVTFVNVACTAHAQGADLSDVAGAGLDDLDRLARRLHAAQASSATRSAARTVATLELHRLLSSREPRYVEESERFRRRVPVALLAVEALVRVPGLADRVRGSDELARVLELADESARKFPDELRPTSRVLLRLGTAEQRALAAEAAGDEVDELAAEIFALAAPYDTAAALSWAGELRERGDDDGAEAVLARCVEAGGTVPFRD